MLEQWEIENALEPYVKKGVAYLDETWPDWHQNINLTTFNISSASYCVLGQLYGDYAKAPIVDATQGEGHGFTLPFTGMGIRGWRAWSALQNLWVKFLKERGCEGEAPDIDLDPHPTCNCPLCLARRGQQVRGG